MNGGNAGAFQRLGRALFKLDDIKEAQKVFQAANKLDKNLQIPEVALANLYIAANDRDNAEKWITAAKKKGGQDAGTQVALGQWMLAANRMDEAKTHAEEATKRDPNSIDAKLLRGLVARLAHDWPTAEAQFSAAHLQSPANTTAINQLALVLLEKGDDVSKRRALELAEINVRINPKNIESGATLGWANYKLNQMPQAEAAFNMVIASHSFTSETAYYVANYLRDMGRTAEATRLLDDALSTDRPFAYRKEAQELLRQLTLQAAEREKKNKPKPDPKAEKDKPKSAANGEDTKPEK